MSVIRAIIPRVAQLKNSAGPRAIDLPELSERSVPIFHGMGAVHDRSARRKPHWTPHRRPFSGKRVASRLVCTVKVRRVIPLREVHARLLNKGREGFEPSPPSEPSVQFSRTRI